MKGPCPAPGVSPAVHVGVETSMAGVEPQQTPIYLRVGARRTKLPGLGRP